MQGRAHALSNPVKTRPGPKQCAQRRQAACACTACNHWCGEGGRQVRAHARSAGSVGSSRGEWNAAPRVSSSRTNTPSLISASSSGRSSSAGPAHSRKA